MHLAYAQALWELIQKGEKPKEAVTRIHDVLATNGRAALMPAVGRAFERLAQRETQKNRSMLVVARRGDEAAARKAFGAKDAELCIDETLIGGWQLFDKDRLTDVSFKKYLLDIYSNSVKHSDLSSTSYPKYGPINY